MQRSSKAILRRKLVGAVWVYQVELDSYMGNFQEPPFLYIEEHARWNQALILAYFMISNCHADEVEISQSEMKTYYQHVHENGEHE